MDAAASQEMLTQLVSDLFYAQVQKRQKEERRVKQTEGVAQAKAAVRFGPEPNLLPDHFDECYKALQDGRMMVKRPLRFADCLGKGFTGQWNGKRK